MHTPITLCVSDPIADKASGYGIYKFIHRLLRERINRIIQLPENSQTYLKAEKLPFSLFDEQAEKERVAWWKTHISILTTS